MAAPASRRLGRLVDAGLWLLTGAMVALVLRLSLGPPPALPSFGLADKVGHALAYAAVTTSALLAAVWRPRRGRAAARRGPLPVLLACVSLGGVVEVAQAFVGRDPSALDFAADLAGTLVGLGLWSLLRRPRSR